MCRIIHIMLMLCAIVSYISAAEVAKDTMCYYEASQFKILGKVYTDSLPMYSRLPQFMKADTRKGVWNRGQNTAGVAVRFRSNSTAITAKWELGYNNNMRHMTPTGIKGLDLYALVNGKWRFVNSAQPNGKDNKWTIIANMNAENREYMLYLPLYDGVVSLEIGVDSTAYITNPESKYPLTARPIVFYGSSIAQGGCATRPGMAGTSIIERRLNVETINLGFSGQAFLDYEVAEMMADVDASIYVLDHVPNASVEQINEKTMKFVNILRTAHPNVPIVFVEDPIFTHCFFDKRIAKEVADKNEAMDSVYKQMKKMGIKDIYLIKGSTLMNDDGESTVDGIHCTDMGFVQYADALTPLLKKLLNNQFKK